MSNARTRKPERAHSVSWQPCSCGCGNFYIELLESNGRAFAQAWFGPEDLRRVADAMYATASQQTPQPGVIH
jgi:hypothetical protein